MRVRQVFSHYARHDGLTRIFKHCPSCGAPIALIESGEGILPACSQCGFVQYRNPAPVVSILIVDGNRILLGKRSGNPGKGTWALPSGYIDYDEDFLTAAIRETKEETGLNIELVSIINVVSSFVSSKYHYLGVYTVARVRGGELAPGDDLEEVKWFPLDQLPAEMGFQEDMDVIRMFTMGAPGLPVDPDYANPDGR